MAAGKPLPKALSNKPSSKAKRSSNPIVATGVSLFDKMYGGSQPHAQSMSNPGSTSLNDTQELGRRFLSEQEQTNKILSNVLSGTNNNQQSNNQSGGLLGNVLSGAAGLVAGAGLSALLGSNANNQTTTTNNINNASALVSDLSNNDFSTINIEATNIKFVGSKFTFGGKRVNGRQVQASIRSSQSPSGFQNVAYNPDTDGGFTSAGSGSSGGGSSGGGSSGGGSSGGGSGGSAGAMNVSAPGITSSDGGGNTEQSVPGDATSAGTKNETGGVSEAIQFFTSKGWSPEQAAGIAANIQMESNFKTNATGDNGKAYGIAQWHPDRQQIFQSVYGKPIQQATFKEQLEYMNYELTSGQEKRAGTALRSTKTAEEAAGLFDQLYERSNGATRKDRMALAKTLMGSSQQMAGQASNGSALASASTKADAADQAQTRSGGTNVMINKSQQQAQQQPQQQQQSQDNDVPLNIRFKQTQV